MLNWNTITQEITAKAKLKLHVTQYNGEFFTPELVRAATRFSMGTAVLFSLGLFRKTTGLFARATYANLTEGSKGLKGGDWANNPELSPLDYELTTPLTNHSALIRKHKEYTKVLGRELLSEERVVLLATCRQTPSAEGVVEIGVGGNKFNANKGEDWKKLQDLLTVGK